MREYLLISKEGRGNTAAWNVRLNRSARYEQSSICCVWSSPTGTWVVLDRQMNIKGKEMMSHLLVQQYVGSL